jgi:hypothetical protein
MTRVLRGTLSFSTNVQAPSLQSLSSTMPSKTFKYWWSSFSAFSSYTTSKNLCILFQTLYSALL